MRPTEDKSCGELYEGTTDCGIGPKAHRICVKLSDEDFCPIDDLVIDDLSNLDAEEWDSIQGLGNDKVLAYK